MSPRSQRPLRGRLSLRAGLTLIEIAVVMAVMALIAMVSVPAISGLLDLQQRAGAKEIADTYRWLIDEAQLRNVTFRIAFDLDAGSWLVEVGDPNTLVFATPEERQEFEEEQEDAMSRYTKREREEQAVELDENGDPMGSAYSDRFEGLSDNAFVTSQTLPGGTRFAWIYTPQYGEEGLEPSDKELGADDEHVIAYTYIFPDGTAEHAVIRIVDEDEEDDGYTIEVNPMTGEVSLSTEVVDPSQSFDWIPTEAPGING